MPRLIVSLTNLTVCEEEKKKQIKFLLISTDVKLRSWLKECALSCSSYCSNLITFRLMQKHTISNSYVLLRFIL